MSTENTHFGAYEIGKMLANAGSIYFIGIGGINMSSLAHISFLRGYRVGGSDRCVTPITESLARAGITVNYSHNAANIAGYDAVVYTVAISPDNPEYAEAKRRGIPCISRADYLGYVMTGYRRRIGISGMHGKSTCTSMCALTFLNAGADPTVLSGAELDAIGGAYRVGGGENFIFEACEYMDSFLDFNPTVAVILNIEMDHVDYFHSMEQIRSSYRRFADITGDDGYAVANADNSDVMKALERYRGHLLTFGIHEGSVFRAVNIKETNGRYSFDIIMYGNKFCHVDLSVPGYHNVYNALACAAAAYICGLSPESIAQGLHKFCGARRRMESKGKLNGADVYDDYGHHPTEVATTLSGAKKLSTGKLWCVFQPHTYSRTKAMFGDFVKALSVADAVLTVDIYAARETDNLGVSSALLSEAIGEKSTYCDSLSKAAAVLTSQIRADDTVVVMGAGDVYKIFDELRLEKE